MKEIKSQRIARRRAKTRGEILWEGSRLFSMIGVEEVRLEDIANAADVARGTLYSFFKNKEAILEELISGIHKKIVSGIESIKHPDPVSRVDALLNLYLDLWENNPHALLVFDQVRSRVRFQHEKYYTQLKLKIEELFGAIEKHLRSRDSNLTMEIFASTSVPSLKTFALRSEYRSLFKDHFRALILNPAMV